MAGWIGRLVAGFGRFLFGDDVFISYSRHDAMDYALAISNELARAGYSCYLDQTLSEPGRELPASLIRGLDRCSMMVLIGTPKAGESASVEREIRLFRTRKGRPRPLVLIDVDSAVSSAHWRQLVEGVPRIPEHGPMVAKGAPTELVLRRALNSATFVRRNARLRNTGAALTLLILLLLVAGAMSFREARRQQAAADRQRSMAEAAAGQVKSLEETKRRTERELTRAAAELTQTRQAKDEALEEAQDATRLADERKRFSDSVNLALAANRTVDASPEIALSSALEALGKWPTVEAQGALIRASAAFVPFRTLKSWSYAPAVFNREESLVAVTVDDSQLEVWRFPDAKRADRAKFSYQPEALAFSDSNTLAVDHAFDPPQIWDSGRRSSPLSVDSSIASAGKSTVSSDGKLIASIGYKEPKLWIWGWNGKVQYEIDLPGLVTRDDKATHIKASTAFVSNQNQVLVAGADGHLYLIDIAAKKILSEARLAGLPHGPLRVRPQGDLFAIPTGETDLSDPALELWTVRPLENTHEGERCGKGSSASFDHDGELLAVANLREGISICSVQSRYATRERQIAEDRLSPIGVDFAPRGSRVLAWGLYDDVRVYDATSGSMLAALKGHRRNVHYGMFSPKADLVVTGLDGDTTRIWSIGHAIDDTTIRSMVDEPAPNANVTTSIAPDGRTVLKASASRQVWRLDEELRSHLVAVPELIGLDTFRTPTVSWDATGSQVVVGIEGGASVLIDRETWTATELPMVQHAEAISPDKSGHFFAYYELYRGIELCNVARKLAPDETTTPVSCPEKIQQKTYVYKLAVRPDASLVAAIASSSDNQIELLVWDRTTSSLQLEVRGDNLQSRFVTFSASGDFLAATAESSNSLASWEVLREKDGWSFRRRATIRSAAPCSGIAMSSDGRLLASWGSEASIDIWDAETGAPIKRIPASSGWSGQGAFVAESTRFASLGYNFVRVDACRACRPLAELAVEAQRDLAASSLARP